MSFSRRFLNRYWRSIGVGFAVGVISAGPLFWGYWLVFSAPYCWRTYP